MSRSFQRHGSDDQPIPDLQVRLFGTFSVHLQGAPLPPLRTRKGAWLLALLLLKHPRPVDRAWLAGTLWPDTDPAGALKNLRNSLSDLRHVLRSQASRLYAPTPSTLALDLDAADVDLTAFDAAIERGEVTALDEAVSLYTGPLLEGCGEEWVVLEREQRQQSCLNALEALAASELQSGHADHAVQRLRRCVSLDALRETAQCALMGALAACGDYAGATEVYRDFRVLLHEELHTQPAAATTALYQQIRVRARQVAAGGATPLPDASLPRPLSDAFADTSTQTSEDLPAGCLALHNLPPSLTSFIGREKERADVQGLLGQMRLLTLTGTGGSGKTRLAVEVAGELVGAYADGVWLVELAALSDPALVVQAVASALNIREQPGEPLLQTLVSTLRPKTLLLLLDNCEHLLESCAELASVLLRSCPHVQLLATSRERLGIAGEQTYRIPPLSLPDLKRSFTWESLSQYEAVRLFIERALLVKADFRLTNTNAPAVASICHRLDGIPLAIELAAARVRLLTVENIDSRLDNRFRLLIGGDRMALPRQQTLRALMDWSYDLLNAEEKLLLSHLSVFAGGWTLEAAEAVCSDFGFWILDFGLSRAPSEETTSGSESDPRNKFGVRKQTLNETSAVQNPKSKIQNEEVLDLLGSLVDKSLVIAEEQEGTVRYRMLETVRQYARDRLVESGESDTVRAAHLGYFLELAETAEPKLMGTEQAEWLQRLEAEHENLRGALDWSLTSREEGGRMKNEENTIPHPSSFLLPPLRLCGALSRFWWMHGHLSEGREWCVRALRTAGGEARSQERARALNGAGVLAWMLGDYASARAYHDESLASFREIGDRGGIAYSLNSLGNVANSQADYASARTYQEESLAIRREIGDRSGIAQSLHNLGNVAYSQGDTAAARASYEESLAIYRVIGNRSNSASSLNNLGNVASMQGDYASARAYQEESLAIRREIGDRSGIAQSLNNLGDVARSQGDDASARTYQEKSLAIQREIGDRRGIAYSLINLGIVADHQGNDASARAYYEESLAIFRVIGDRGGIAASLEAFAGLAFKESKSERATVLWAAAEGLREEIGSPLQLTEREAYEQATAEVRQALGEEAFAVAWAKGRAMTLEQVMDYAVI